MEQTTFKIKSLPDLEFRTAFKSGIELLSFKMTMGFDSIEGTTDGLNWLLERVEVNIGGKWLPIKEPGMEVYYPDNLGNDLVALMEIAFQMLATIKAVFKKSSELSQKQ